MRQESNKGVAAARNRGLVEAKGDYITFFDQDDLLHDHALECLQNAIELANCDVSAAGIRQFDDDPGPQHSNFSVNLGKVHVSKNPLHDFFAPEGNDAVDVDVWGKLYRSSAIVGIAFPDNVFGADDYVFSARVFSIISSVVYLDIPLYLYRMHSANVTMQMPMRYIMGTLRSREIVWSEACVNPLIDTAMKATLREMDASGLVEFGGHTAGHTTLTTVSLNEAKREIEDNKRWIEEVLGKEIVSFCYPRGGEDDAIVELVKSASYKYAAAMKKKMRPVGTDPYRIHRQIIPRGMETWKSVLLATRGKWKL